VRSLDRSQGGLGIGLALVRSLVALHRGTVSAESAGKGLGSRFTVSLPRLIEPVRPLGAAQDGAIPAARGGNLKVLIVDDNADAAAMLAMFLESCGHTVLVEHDPFFALKRAGREALGACAAEGGEAKRAKNECGLVARTSPGCSPGRRR